MTKKSIPHTFQSRIDELESIARNAEASARRCREEADRLRALDSIVQPKRQEAAA